MSIEVGSKVSGKISGITNFGAFVDLGDKKTGLVHISEVSDGFVKDIHGDRHNDGRSHERGNGNRPMQNRKFPQQSHRQEPKRKDFDSLLAGFLKESDERLTSLKRNTEGKRGGRGGRRS